MFLGIFEICVKYIHLAQSSHSDVVASVSWGKKVLYSGSHDCHVIEWDLVDGTAQHQWKADRHTVTSVCCHGKGELLLSAGCSIKMWNLSDYTLLQVRRSQYFHSAQFISSSKLPSLSLFAFTRSEVFALYIGHTLMNFNISSIILFLIKRCSNYRFKKFVGLASQKIIQLIMYILLPGTRWT